MQLGIIPLKEAQDLARDSGLDLVEVSPMERPPVCRIIDYGKYKYERKKRQKMASHSHVVTTKEIRLRPKTDVHDLVVKMKRVHEFLADGDKVQFTMLFRGRERFHKERANVIFDRLLAELGDTIKVERRPTVEGRRMTMVVAPVKQTGGGGGAQKPAAPKKKEAPAKSATDTPAPKPTTTDGAAPPPAAAEKSETPAAVTDGATPTPNAS